MKKLATFLEKAVIWLFVMMYEVIILLNSCFDKIDYFGRKDFFFPIIGFVLVGILLVFAIFKMYKAKKKSVWKIINFINEHIIVCTIVLFLLQVVISINIYFMTGWDSGILTVNADYVANGQTSELWNWYYSRCPNNSLLTFIYMIFFWIAEHIGVPSTVVRLLIVITQCVISSLTGLLLYCVSKKYLKSIAWSVFAWFVFVILVGLSPWVIIPYSDATCLFLPMLLLWIYQSLNQGHTVLKCIAISVIAYLGYEIKPMVIIILIAMFGAEILKWMSSEEKKKCWMSITVMFISLTITVGICKVVSLENMMGFTINQEAEFGMTHYLMMGLNYEHSGVFIKTDADFSESIATNAERKSENIRVAKERIKEFGPIGLIKHTIRKSMVNFKDGTFAWWNEGDFFGIELSIPNNPITSFLRNLYYDHGSLHMIFKVIAQLFWMLVLIGNVLQIVALVGKSETINKCHLVIILSLIGLTLFVMIFEARARYLYVYVPIYIISGIQGYQFLYNRINSKSRSSENTKQEQENNTEKESLLVKE